MKMCNVHSERTLLCFQIKCTGGKKEWLVEHELQGEQYILNMFCYYNFFFSFLSLSFSFFWFAYFTAILKYTQRDSVNSNKNRNCARYGSRNGYIFPFIDSMKCSPVPKVFE